MLIRQAQEGVSLQVGTDIVIEPKHIEQLTGQASLADKVRYACEQVSPPTTRAVWQ